MLNTENQKRLTIVDQRGIIYLRSVMVKQAEDNMGISDIIARYILEELQHENGSAMLSRSELANRFNCVPSQINYVLMTRFSPEHGYTVESRRGGSGYIRVSRVNMDRGMLFMHVVNAVGESIDTRSAAAFLNNMRSAGAITTREAGLIAAAISDNALATAGKEQRRSESEHSQTLPA